MKRVFVLMLPVTLGLGLINVNALIGSFFAARFIDRTISPSAIDAAFRIYMVPQGMFSVAVATVYLRRSRDLPRAVTKRASGAPSGSGFARSFLLVPASIAFAVLAGDRSVCSTNRESSGRTKPTSSPPPSPPSRSV